MNKIMYYKILIFYGFICLILIFSNLFVNLYESRSSINLSIGLKETLLNILLLLAIIGMYIIYPLFFDQMLNKVYTKYQYIFLAIIFILFALFYLIGSIIAKTSLFLKYFGLPLLAIIFLIYGITFIHKMPKKKKLSI